MANSIKLISQTIITPITIAKIVTSIAVAKLISCLLEITTKHIINPTINKTIPRILFTPKKIMKNIITMQQMNAVVNTFPISVYFALTRPKAIFRNMATMNNRIKNNITTMNQKVTVNNKLLNIMI